MKRLSPLLLLFAACAVQSAEDANYVIDSVELSKQGIDPPGNLLCTMDFTGSAALPAKVSCTVRHTTANEWNSCSDKNPAGSVYSCVLKFKDTYTPTGAAYSEGFWEISHISSFAVDGTSRLSWYGSDLETDGNDISFELGAGGYGGAPACTPGTCISNGFECGTGHDDGCGGTFDCGTAGACTVGSEICSNAPLFQCDPPVGAGELDIVLNGAPAGTTWEVRLASDRSLVDSGTGSGTATGLTPGDRLLRAMGMGRGQMAVQRGQLPDWTLWPVHDQCSAGRGYGQLSHVCGPARDYTVQALHGLEHELGPTGQWRGHHHQLDVQPTEQRRH